MWTIRRYVSNVLTVGAHVLRTLVEIVLSRLAAFAHIALGRLCRLMQQSLVEHKNSVERFGTIGVRFRTPPCFTQTMLQIVAVRIGTKHAVRAVLLASYASHRFALPRQSLLVNMELQQRLKIAHKIFPPKNERRC